ncbi:hypothetical protein A2U01_0093938, partial [Trifolium medium]|nr:hypothetical protein [Trifolium medium]
GNCGSLEGAAGGLMGNMFSLEKRRSQLIWLERGNCGRLGG